MGDSASIISYQEQRDEIALGRPDRPYTVLERSRAWAQLGMVALAFNPSTQDSVLGQAGGPL